MQSPLIVSVNVPNPGTYAALAQIPNKRWKNWDCLKTFHLLTSVPAIPMATRELIKILSLLLPSFHDIFFLVFPPTIVKAELG